MNSILKINNKDWNVLYVTDYINGGELFTHLYQREKFTENEVRIYIGEIVLALEHLHKVRPKSYERFSKSQIN